MHQLNYTLDGIWMHGAKIHNCREPTNYCRDICRWRDVTCVVKTFLVGMCDICR